MKSFGILFIRRMKEKRTEEVARIDKEEIDMLLQAQHPALGVYYKY